MTGTRTEGIKTVLHPVSDLEKSKPSRKSSSRGPRSYTSDWEDDVRSRNCDCRTVHDQLGYDADSERSSCIDRAGSRRSGQYHNVGCSECEREQLFFTATAAARNEAIGAAGKHLHAYLLRLS